MDPERIDQDMAAHSACDFGGGKAEKLALARYRQAVWQGRVLNSQFTDEELRSQGRCPLTPEEVGLLLANLGFDNSTRLYLASHKVKQVTKEKPIVLAIEDKEKDVKEEERPPSPPPEAVKEEKPVAEAPPNLLGGGLDKLTLDSLYDDAMRKNNQPAS
ncbi:hypothetical protein RND81_10G029500 [Saponaria officinalis]|uniref:O-fucosyltransferase family protein n=1 Tax=Saponaria officinalis TaxID=3572 RepID=A0AAW1HXN8_SAPOF